MELSTNPWFIGIFGGLISGILVYFITSIIASFINKKEYNKAVQDLNFKLSGMLIMSIAEDKIPNAKMIDSISKSLARRHNVKRDDINSIEDTYDDLVRELFETNFISVERKQKLANDLIYYKLEYLIEKQESTTLPTETEYTLKRTQRSTIIVSMITISLGVLLGSYTLAEFRYLFSDSEYLLINSLALSSFSFVYATLWQKAKNERRTNRNKSNDKPIIRQSNI